MAIGKESGCRLAFARGKSKLLSEKMPKHRKKTNFYSKNHNFTKGGGKMNNGYDVNQALQSIFQMRNAGRNPQQIMQMLIQQNQLKHLMDTTSS